MQNSCSFRFKERFSASACKWAVRLDYLLAYLNYCQMTATDEETCCHNNCTALMLRGFISSSKESLFFTFLNVKQKLEKQKRFGEKKWVREKKNGVVGGVLHVKSSWRREEGLRGKGGPCWFTVMLQTCLHLCCRSLEEETGYALHCIAWGYLFVHWKRVSGGRVNLLMSLTVGGSGGLHVCLYLLMDVIASQRRKCF